MSNKQGKALMLCAIVALCAGLLPSCSADREFIRSLPKQPHTPHEEVTVRYLGTGCFLIAHKGRTLLTDPFVSNPGPMRSLAGQVTSDTAYINRMTSPEEFANVRMVISGHSHYDHLLDLPYLSRWIPEDALMCVNRTGTHLLAPFGITQPIVAVDSLAADSVRMGQWLYAPDSSMRCMAIHSLHPPQVMGMHLMRGHYTADLTAPPTRIWDWLQGRTHAFLVDFMENGRPEFRLYLSSSMAPAPFGLFPEELTAEKKVDAVFLGAAGDYDPQRYPAPALRLTDPAQVYLIHWESFFRSKDKKAKAISRRGLRDFHDRVKAEVPPHVPITLTVPLKTY
jgi:hypothetical protein